MDELADKIALLNNIRHSEEDSFEFEENAILDEYQIRAENKSTLAIKILTIFGGILATLAFLGFLLLVGLYNSSFGLLFFGLAFIVLAIWLNIIYKKLIIDTFCISIYVIGFSLFAFGFSEMYVDENIISVLIALIAFFSLFLTQNYILSFISGLVISANLLFLVIINETYILIHLYIAIHAVVLTYIFLNEAKLISLNKKISRLYNPIRISLLVSLLFGLISVGKRHLLPVSQNYIWLSSFVLIGIVVYLVSMIINIIKIKRLKSKVIIYLLSSIILISTLFSPSISGAMVIILLSFMVNYKTGLAIGIISLIYFVSQYYYDLTFTLLTKSIILFVSGLMFLLFYFFAHKNTGADEKI